MFKNKFKINEIFYSIQGEGAQIGMAAVFIRFSGCNLSCRFCDTEHKAFRRMSLRDILKEVKKYLCKNIIITGGEPTIQRVEDLIIELKVNGFYVSVETNGHDLKKLLEADWITLSPKKDIETGGTVNGKYIKDLYDRIWSELKILFISPYSPQQFEKYMVKENRNFIQPLSTRFFREADYFKDLLEYIKKNPRWRLSLQCQKLILIK